MEKRYERRKSEHLCVRCGNRDERTEAGKVLCAKCEAARSAYQDTRRSRFAPGNMCVYCGAQDERTMSGLRICGACDRYRSLTAKARYDGRKKSGVCPKCGSPLPEWYSRVICDACLQKIAGKKQQE